MSFYLKAAFSWWWWYWYFSEIIKFCVNWILVQKKKNYNLFCVIQVLQFLFFFASFGNVPVNCKKWRIEWSWEQKKFEYFISGSYVKVNNLWIGGLKGWFL